MVRRVKKVIKGLEKASKTHKKQAETLKKHVATMKKPKPKPKSRRKQMATYVNDLRLKEIATGDEAGTWGTSTNTNLELIAEAFSFGTEAITTNADTHTTTIADGSTDPGRSIYLQYTGALDSDCTVTIGPNTVSKLWFIENATTDSGSSGPYNIIIKQGSGATVTVPNGNVKAIYSDGAGSGGKMVDAFTDLHVNGLTSEVTGNDPALTVTSTDADASIGPLIVFKRESSSPADDDLLGRINFNGLNDASAGKTYGRIQTTIRDASDGTEDGELTLSTIVAGTNRSRAKFGATETVFNEASVDLDFRIESDSNTHRFFLQNDNIIMGHSSGITLGGVGSALQVIGNSSATRSVSIINFSADANAPILRFGKSRGGSIGSNTVVQSGDNIGQLLFCADDGSDLGSKAAQILAEVDGTPGSDDMPGRLVFQTTADGSDSVTEAMRIDDSGALLINTTTDYGGKVNIESDASGSSESALALVSTAGAAADGPILDLNRQTASPADDDNTGLIRFKSTNSAAETVAYAEIDTFTQDVTDGTEDGMIRIRTVLNGTLRSRIEFDQTETVINENSVDLDFRVETNGAANKFFVDGGNNVVVIGNNAPVSSVSVDSTFQIQGNSNANAGMSINRYTSNNSGSYINLSKSRSTSVGDNFTIVQDGDTLGRVSFVAADGTNFGHQAAKIVGALDGTPGENDVPGRLEFHTTGDGNNSPSERMRVNDNGDILINTTTDFGGKVNIARADNNTTLALVCTDNDAADGPILDFIRDSSSPATTDDIAVINFKADDSAGNRDIYAQIAVFSPGVTSGSEQGRIKINTNDGSAGLQNRVDLTTDETVFNQDSHNLDFRVESNGYTHMIFVDGGNNHVGIGTDTPLSALHVATAASGVSAVGTTNDDLVLENSGDVGFSILCPNDHTGSIVFGDPDDNNVGILAYNHNDDSMRFTVGASEAARIISDVLCVGTTTTVADDMTARACHIASNATTTGPSLIVDDSDTSVESGSICMAVMFSNDNAFSAAKYISFRDIGGEQGSITGDGTGSVAYNTSSDMRLKTNIQDTASQWDTIKALQVRDYEWIGNGNEETGFIAQEIHEQIPQVVYVGGEEAAKEPWAVDYGRITPQLTKALQEAMARIETLESELAKLKEGGS